MEYTLTISKANDLSRPSYLLQFSLANLTEVVCQSKGLFDLNQFTNLRENQFDPWQHPWHVQWTQ